MTKTPADQPAPTIATDLRGLLVAVRRRALTVLVVVVVALGASVALTQRQTPEFVSHARVLVLPTSDGSAVYLFQPVNMETERGLVASSVVADLVQQRLGVEGSPASLLSGLRVSVEQDTEILDVGYVDPDPARAQTLAQAFAQAYLDFRELQADQRVEAQIAEVESDIETTGGQAADLSARIAAETDPFAAEALQAQLAALDARLSALQRNIVRLSSRAQVGAAGEVVQPATLPTAPSTAGYVQNGVLAVVLGLALGVALALARERLDDRIRGREDLEEASGLPVLAVVPRLGQWRDRRSALLAMRELPDSPAAEAYRALRTAVLFVAGQRDPGKRDFRLLLVTSPQTGDGKTTTTANLAVALGQAGKRVIVVSGDLRKPRIHRFFEGVTNEIGLVDVLSDGMPLSQAVQATEFPTVRVLACGSATSHMAEIVHVPSMNRLLADLRVLADLVLIDSAPVLAVSDTVAIASEVDGVLLVTQSGGAERRAVAHARELLDQVNSRLIGAVLNGHDPVRTRGYPYRYYGYGDEGAHGSGRRGANGRGPSTTRERSGEPVVEERTTT